ncbi:MAG: hypothetical protein CVU42_02130 [Chloroflexi bacterium HGW-Chloroflexi-4]|jgi:hypothetical protein|nr:MAG: hypothetical protein CVU42_02130 [Chloroflexi bacterium HGW-Chloroflexi-4]
MITPRFLRNVLIKGLVIFAVINLVWAAFNPSLGKLSSYNILFEGRERLPFGEDSARAYNLSLYDLDAMFASHKLAGSTKATNEFRVFVIGDSASWGTLLKPEETLAGRLDSAGLKTASGKEVKVYNLGYPTLSLTKDVMILEYAMQYQPDLILWLVTLESFPRERQLLSPIVVNNQQRVAKLINGYGLNLTPPEGTSSFWDKTIIGQRRALADLLRLQFYGVMWSATGVDQTYPADYEPAARDLEADDTFRDWAPPTIPDDGLALDVVHAGMQVAGKVPVVLINEPMLVSTGENSDSRYNFYYPRWAYDQYRLAFSESCSVNSWPCLDLWDVVPQERFTNSAIHLDPLGEGILMEEIIKSNIFFNY